MRHSGRRSTGHYRVLQLTSLEACPASCKASLCVMREEANSSPLHRCVTAMHATTSIRASLVLVYATIPPNTCSLQTCRASVPPYHLDAVASALLAAYNCDYECTHARALDLPQANRSDRTPSVAQIGCRDRPQDSPLRRCEPDRAEKGKKEKKKHCLYGNAMGNKGRQGKRNGPRQIKKALPLLIRIGTSNKRMKRKRDGWNCVCAYKVT